MRKVLILLGLLVCIGPRDAAGSPASAPPDAGLLEGSSGTPAPVVVDPTAGTVTPTPGTLPSQVTGDPVGFAQKMIAALKGGQWRLVLAGALALLMVAGVKLRVRVFGMTDRGKSIAVMTLALLAALSASLSGAVPVSLQLFVGASTVAFTAVGARQWLSRLLWPQDGARQWLTWLKPLLGVGVG